ncbi:MAG: 50S ribosomal protein L4 [Candidatus Yanofskybacteria bacterium RIFCSPLOWO2_02_FULL_47_9b]|uniref:Large ribosomal subunit protein uL4 n=1 Tax=Candidatus Yanofskybacteria bacterium RIFCSPLOWO2_02_FULL_47_9b TaxID=1802708 RepID=A0A1F8H729_9BACT|nr:MAG: 50S ribosomal protein L4 [Candidatus Yanofskybacteria bacterium RIFCSPLOWO2_02_FULL_47_9b]
MELPLYNQSAENIGTVEVQNSVFGLAMNKDLLYQVITSMIANKRQVIAHAKHRGEVRGGGKKPWQQKGTGRARHGSIRSPIWKGGGVTHGPTKERNFKKVLNRKMVQQALRVALSAKAREQHILVVDSFILAQPKTKELVAILKNFSTVAKKLNSMLIVIPDGGENLYKSARNIPFLTTIEAKNLNPLSVSSSTVILMPQAALDTVQKLWGKN